MSQLRIDYLEVVNEDDFAVSDEMHLKALLQSFEMEFLLPFLHAADITFRSLRYLSTDDINTAIRSVGYRAEFREKLFAWRRIKFNTNDCTIENVVTTDETETINESAVVEEANLTNTRNSEPESPKRKAPSSNGSVHEELYTMLSEDDTEIIVNNEEIAAEYEHEVTIQKKSDEQIIYHNLSNENFNIERILNKANFGNLIKTTYNRQGHLEVKHRDMLIQSIVDYLISNNIRLRVADFQFVLDEIVRVFPSEQDTRDYYFLKRGNRNNPIGRLFTKYHNCIKKYRNNLTLSEIEICSKLENESYVVEDVQEPIKKRRLSSTPQTQVSSSYQLEENIIENIPENVIEIHSETPITEQNLLAFKTFLSCEDLEWNDIQTMWAKTYPARLEDIKNCSTSDVLELWPKYLMTKGSELFNIDFKRLYPNKCRLLYTKFPVFKQKIQSYYTHGIKEVFCKGLLQMSKAHAGKDIEICNYFLLLNAVMPPSARFKLENTTTRRKASILEAVEWFVIRVQNIRQLEDRKKAIQMKICPLDEFPLAPNIVVVGEHNMDIKQIYVNFDNVIYKMPNFLSAVDTCFKIFQVLEIPYPAAIAYPWTFIQKYFFDINLSSDTVCPMMSAILKHLKM